MNESVLARYETFLPDAGTRQSVATSLGLVSPPEGNAPLQLHAALRGVDYDRLSGGAHVNGFEVAGAQFWWVYGTEKGGELDRSVALEGHAVQEPPKDFQESVVVALGHIANVPWAFQIVRQYITSFGYVVADPGASRPITSCTVPDFPLMAFFSRIALRHIPPLTVAGFDDPHLLAENIFHEAVHQYVNHQLLTKPVMSPGYDSATSPGIPISWRRDAAGVPQTWQVDRVLHAATVYTNLLAWRYTSLESEATPARVREVVRESLADALGSAEELYAALERHVSQFSPWGAHRVGQLTDRTRTYMTMVAAQSDRLVGAGSRPRELA